MSEDPVVLAYSRRAADYDSPENLASCWGRNALELASRLPAGPGRGLIVDVGCGAGGALAQLAARCPPPARLLGIEPAAGLRERARAALAGFPNVAVRDGRFEALPLDAGTVGYLFSIMAFHWVADAARSAREIARVLRAGGEADLFFVGRWNGREFIRATSPIFLRHMGPARLLEAARLRQHLEAGEAHALFESALPGRTVTVEEEYRTYHDDLDGHWAWWVRIEGQLMRIPEERRVACEEQVRAALQALATADGIPYTLHILHVRIGPAGR